MTNDELIKIAHSVMRNPSRQRQSSRIREEHTEDKVWLALQFMVNAILEDQSKPRSCPIEFQHDYLRPDAFKFCPECGTDIRVWQSATRELRRDLAPTTPPDDLSSL